MRFWILGSLGYSKYYRYFFRIFFSYLVNSIIWIQAIQGSKEYIYMTLLIFLDILDNLDKPQEESQKCWLWYIF